MNLLSWWLAIVTASACLVAFAVWLEKCKGDD